MLDEHASLQSIIKKQAKLLISQEMRDSSFDLRSIEARGMISEQVKQIKKTQMPHKQEFEHVIYQKNNPKLDSKLKRNREKQKGNGLKRDRPKEPDAGPDLDSDTNTFIELGLLNKHLINKR